MKAEILIGQFCREFRLWRPIAFDPVVYLTTRRELRRMFKVLMIIRMKAQTVPVAFDLLSNFRQNQPKHIIRCFDAQLLFDTKHLVKALRSSFIGDSRKSWI